jgi:hypothetical protein
MSSRVLRNLQQMFRNLRQASRQVSQLSRILRRSKRVVATFFKFNNVAALPWNGGCNLQVGQDALKVMLTNTAPAASNAAYADVSGGELPTGGGYTVGGATVTTTASGQTAGLWVFKGTAASPTWSATASLPAFRYVILYDTTPTTPTNKPLLGWWDYGSVVNMNSGDTFTVQFDSVNGILQMS